MTNVSKRCLEPRKRHKAVGDHDKFLERIKKTLYYGKLPVTDRLSLPVTEFATEIFSEVQYGHSLKRLHCDVAASISRNACVSPCSLILAMMYLERLKTYNPEYLKKAVPSELFLISLMVSSKFLNDDGEDSEVFIDEWAVSGGVTVRELIQMEKEFLDAIQWKVFVNEKTFWSRLNDLERTIALRQGTQRGGWFTYTDLQYLLNDIEVYNLIQTLLTVTTVMVASYAASVLTIVGSVLIASQIPGTSLDVSRSLVPTIDKSGTVVSFENIAPSDTELLSEIIISALAETEEDDKNNTASKQKYATIQKTIDPVNVLTTSFILASIHTSNEHFTKPNNTYEENTTESITWDWWTSDLMNWLYEISAPENDNVIDARENEQPQYYDCSKKFDYCKRLDMTIANVKLLNLEDQIHKPSSTRIQDQLENSWHKEWTDTIFQKYLKPYYRLASPLITSVNLF